MDSNNSLTMEQEIAAFLIKHGKPLVKYNTDYVVVAAEVVIHGGKQKLQFSAFHASHGRHIYSETIEDAVKECDSLTPDKIVSTRLIKARRQVELLEAIAKEGRAV